MRRVLVAFFVAGVLSLAAPLAGCGDDVESPPGPASPQTATADSAAANSAATTIDGGAAVADAAPPTAGTCQKVAQYCADSPYALFLEPLTEENCNAVFQCLLDTYAPPCVARWQAVLDCIDAAVSSAEDCNTRCWSEMLAFMGNCECLSRCGATNCPQAGVDGGVPTDTGCGMPSCPDV